jgi:hypothetical protein
MRRLWLRFRCLLGLHAWHWATTENEDEIERRHCGWCKRWQARGRELKGWHRGVRLVGWSRWEPYQPMREPWGPEFY